VPSTEPLITHTISLSIILVSLDPWEGAYNHTYTHIQYRHGKYTRDNDIQYLFEGGGEGRNSAPPKKRRVAG